MAGALLLGGCGIAPRFPWTPDTLSDASHLPPPGPPGDAGVAGDGLPGDGTPTGAMGDGGTTPRADAGGSVPDARAPLPALDLTGPCDTTLTALRNLWDTDGTLPAPGPFRPCGVFGGQSFRQFAFSGNGTYLAALGAGGQIQVLSSASLSTLTTLARTRGAYTAFAISPSGSLVAAASERDGELDLWRVADHQLLLAIDLGPQRSFAGGAVAVTEGYRVAASAGAAVVVIDVPFSGPGPAREVRRVANDVGSAVGWIGLIDGGRQLIWEQHAYTLTGNLPSVFNRLDIASGQVTGIPGAQSVRVSADGRSYLVTAGTGYTVWDSATGAWRGQGPTEDGAAFLSVLGFSAGGDEVRGVVTDFSTYPTQYRLQRRRISDGGVLEDAPLSLPSGLLAWSESGDILVAETATSDSGLLARVDPRRPQVIRRACAPPAVSSPVGFSRDGARMLALGGQGPTAYDVASGQALGPAGAGASYSPTLLSADGRWVAANRRRDIPTATPPGALELYDIDHLQGHLLYGDTNQPIQDSPGAFSVDSRLLASLSFAGSLSVYDTGTARRVGMVSLGAPLSMSGARVLGISSDDQLVRLSQGGVLQDLRWSDGVIVAEQPMTGSPQAASADGSVVVTSADSASAAIYRDGVRVATIPQVRTGEPVLGSTWMVAVSPDGSLVASTVSWNKAWLRPSGPETEVRDTSTGELIQVLPFSTPAALSWTGGLIATGNTLWCR